MNSLFKRCDKLAFYGVKNEDGSVTYKRMTGFTEIATKKQPKEYKRQYIDQEFETTDVVGYSPVISYSFDRFTENPVHKDIARITDEELLGTDAVRSIVIVDMKTDSGKGKSAICRDFSVIPDSEGGEDIAYTYSGSFKANSAKEMGTAETGDDWETISYTMNLPQ